ncbi:hypothetical protein MTO96_045451 [Rhipicephalus appendiculatus]
MHASPLGARERLLDIRADGKRERQDYGGGGGASFLAETALLAAKKPLQGQAGLGVSAANPDDRLAGLAGQAGLGISAANPDDRHRFTTVAPEETTCEAWRRLLQTRTVDVVVVFRRGILLTLLRPVLLVPRWTAAHGRQWTRGRLALLAAMVQQQQQPHSSVGVPSAHTDHGLRLNTAQADDVAAGTMPEVRVVAWASASGRRASGHEEVSRTLAHGDRFCYDETELFPIRWAGPFRMERTVRTVNGRP